MDKLEIEITEDGTIKISSDKVSGANHANAEAFYKLLAQNAGGATTRERKQGHGHVHEHDHAGTKHSH